MHFVYFVRWPGYPGTFPFDKFRDVPQDRLQEKVDAFLEAPGLPPPGRRVPVYRFERLDVAQRVAYWLNQRFQHDRTLAGTLVATIPAASLSKSIRRRWALAVDLEDSQDRYDPRLPKHERDREAFTVARAITARWVEELELEVKAFGHPLPGPPAGQWRFSAGPGCASLGAEELPESRAVALLDAAPVPTEPSSGLEAPIRVDAGRTVDPAAVPPEDVDRGDDDCPAQYYVYGRRWPGYHEGFPFHQFRACADAAAVRASLDAWVERTNARLAGMQTKVDGGAAPDRASAWTVLTSLDGAHGVAPFPDWRRWNGGTDKLPTPGESFLMLKNVGWEEADALADWLNDRFECGPDVVRFELVYEDEIDAGTRERWCRAADDPRLLEEDDRRVLAKVGPYTARWMLRGLCLTTAQEDVVARAAWLVVRYPTFFAGAIRRLASRFGAEGSSPSGVRRADSLCWAVQEVVESAAVATVEDAVQAVGLIVLVTFPGGLADLGAAEPCGPWATLPFHADGGAELPRGAVLFESGTEDDAPLWKVHVHGEDPLRATCAFLRRSLPIVEAEMRRVGLLEASEGVPAEEDDSDYFSSRWFEANTNIPSDRLRKAAEKGRLRVKPPDGVRYKQNRYSASDAKALWPHDWELKSGKNRDGT